MQTREVYATSHGDVLAADVLQVKTEFYEQKIFGTLEPLINCSSGQSIFGLPRPDSFKDKHFPSMSRPILETSEKSVDVLEFL